MSKIIIPESHDRNYRPSDVPIVSRTAAVMPPTTHAGPAPEKRSRFIEHLPDGSRRWTDSGEQYEPPSPWAAWSPQGETLTEMEARDPNRRVLRAQAELPETERKRIWTEEEIADLSHEEYRAAEASIRLAMTEGRVRARGQAVSPSERTAPQLPVFRESEINAMSVEERRRRWTEISEALRDGRVITVERENE